MRVLGLNSGSLVLVAFFAVFLCCYRVTSVNNQGSGTGKNISKYICGVIAGIFFVFLFRTRITEGFDNKLFVLVSLLLSGLGAILLCTCICEAVLTRNYLKELWAQIKICVASINCGEKEIGYKENYKKIKGLPLITFFLCMLCYLPYFLYEFPAIMTPDSINQLEQIMGVIPYANHHPVFDTWMIGAFVKLGLALTGDISIAVSFYVVFQMLLMSLAATYVIWCLQNLRINNHIIIAVGVLFAVLPYNGVFAVTVWKDIPFAVFALLFMVSQYMLIKAPIENALPVKSKGHKDKTLLVYQIVFVISGILTALFRSNGFIAMVIFLIISILYWGAAALKQKDVSKKTGIILPVMLIIILFLHGPFLKLQNINQPDMVESLSIPLQQVARVLVNDRDLKPQELEQIDRVIDRTYIKELYAPDFADNIKELVRAGNPEEIENNKGEYIRLYMALFTRYPADYIAAYYDEVEGYVNPQLDYPIADAEGVYSNSLGIANHNLIGGKLVVKSKEIWGKLWEIIPIYAVLFNMGSVFMLTAIIFLWAAVKQKKALLICLVPQLLIMLTVLIATPVAAEFRYAYSMMYAFPTIIALVCDRSAQLTA